LQSADVAAGRYKAGVGSIIDLLTAQSALADARAQEVQARSLWFLAMAQLAHATGALVPKAAEIMSATTRNQEKP
jgi:outer membrane protein TolC